MALRLSCRPTFADLTAIALVLWSAGYSMVMIRRSGPESLFAQVMLAVLALLALHGMHLLKRHGDSTILWGVIGGHIALGMVTIFSIGPGLLFTAASLILYAVMRARHLGVPVIDGWGLLAEAIGFMAFPTLLFILV